MDWAKAKTILIIAFTIVNIFLGTNLWLEKFHRNDILQVSAQEIDKVIKILNSEEVYLKTDIPETVEPLPFLTIGRSSYEHEEIAKGFFKSLDNVEINETSQNITYTKNEKQLIIMENGVISFFNNEVREKKYNLNEEKAKDLAIKFIENHGNFPDNAKFDRIVYYNHSNSYLVEFIQEYEGKVLASSYINVLVNPSGIKSYYKSWLELHGPSSSSKKLISPVHALLKILDVIDDYEKPINITSIEVGYYSKHYDAEEWQAVPVWRISINGDEYYYVNCYTGELEQ